MNMFKPSAANSVDEYLAAVPEQRQELVRFLHRFIQKTVPNLRVHFASNMIGYGSFPFKGSNPTITEWPIIALANQKNYVSLYVCAAENGQYLAETFRDQLGKVSVGKSCIRFKQKTDLNLEVLAKLLKRAEKSGGLAQSKK